MRFAQILNNRAHWIFEADEKPDFPPDTSGNPIVLVDITDNPEVQEGWVYEYGEFTEPPLPESIEPIPIIEPVTNEEVVQAVMYLTAIQDISMKQTTYNLFDIESQSSRYEFWRFAYFRKHTNVFTLDKLVEGGVLTRDEAAQIIDDRIEEFGI